MSAAIGLDAASTDEAEVRAYLDRYQGAWNGEVSVENTNGDILRTFPLAAEYWKSGDRLKGLTAFEVEGKMTFIESENYFRHGLLYADVTQGGKTITYRGYLREGRLFWMPYDAELNTERRMKEWFVEENGQEILYVEGEELLRSDKGTAKVILRGRMSRD
ncbi:MAG: hypothetical protein ACQKBT_10935 [Puniceicoccales bacterium]